MIVCLSKVDEVGVRSVREVIEVLDQDVPQELDIVDVEDGFAKHVGAEEGFILESLVVFADLLIHMLGLGQELRRRPIWEIAL